jgi:hypothetical protein
MRAAVNVKHFPRDKRCIRVDVMKRVLEISINEPIGTKSFLTRIEPHVCLVNRVVVYSIGKPEVDQTLFS